MKTSKHRPPPSVKQYASSTPKKRSSKTPAGFIKLPKFLRNKHTSLLIFIALFAGVGSYLLIFSHAAPIPLATIEAETMTLPAGTTVVADSTASNSQAIKFSSNGTATTNIALSAPATSLTVRAKGIQCQGSPQLVLKVDNVQVLASLVSSTTWSESYTATNLSLSATTHALSLSFTNDNTYTHQNARKNCSRDLFVDKVTIFGETTSTPAPTVSLTANPTTVTSGSTSTLNWTTTNATSCSASGGWTGTKPTNGTEPTPAVTTNITYTLTCTGPGGTGQGSASVTTNSLPLNQVLGFNTLDPTTSDEFNASAGTKPDSVRWHAKTFTATNGSVAYWNGLNNVQMDGAGNLDVYATRNADGTHWSSGWISGNKSYVGSHYIEARSKLPAGAGTWASPIWEWDAPYGNGGIENDVIEQLGIEPQAFHSTLHNVGGTQISRTINTTSILANDYHTYGAAVYADHVDYYLDGAKVQTITKTEFGGKWGYVENAMVLNINLDMGGWGGTPSPSLPSPLHMLVDNIRLYKP